MNCLQRVPEPGYIHYHRTVKGINKVHAFQPRDKSYRVDMHKLDEQHEALSQALKRWHDRWMSDSTPAVTKRSLTNLTCQCRIYFSSTEEIMRAHGYPGYQLHKSMHELLLQQLDSVQSLQDCEYRQSWIERLEVGEYLSAFLASHIDNEAAKLEIFLKRISRTR
ncbi:MAG: hemerythrin family protein [Mariprofundaceae bacterium]|nr:hemerythrin family protein [Mariprofundaceae bacterium]